MKCLSGSNPLLSSRETEQHDPPVLQFTHWEAFKVCMQTPRLLKEDGNAVLELLANGL